MSGAQRSAQADTFHATGMDDLPALAAFVGAACERAGADADTLFAVRLAVEEVFANIVHHGYADQPGPVDVNVDTSKQRIVIALTDQAPLFDPSGAPEPRVDAPIEQREPGGLGWHLVYRMMDAVTHQPGSNGGNVVTLVKRLRPNQQDS